ncbi:DUF2306 domain-containing protein [Olleya sp. HaHaR_3_96]|uniref:DUF2306 domain-containing protein n=1 Tax=Olleya sp. HaHaR_3_96 TaxID=2745560 RepID=UPI001C4E42D8|nr:DUF2306 domain-containing protein [Olleya sp. HaHaR_3_96]QXP59516.1 DUF2306 domain-containing protein [Olleya sp. HaHaR_3_96]
MNINFNRFLVLKVMLYGVLIYFIYLLALITVQYIPIDYKVAFLNLKQKEIQLLHYKIAFFSHVYSSLLIIILGLTQFSKTIRQRFGFIHKLSGKLYVLLVLLIASPSGLIMAYYANGGYIGQVSFAILSILWFVFTLQGFQYIKKGNYQKHKHFMIRSYALTLSAISLRLFKFGIVTLFELPPMDTYKIVSVLGWTVNLVIAEVIIRKSAFKKLNIKKTDLN